MRRFGHGVGCQGGLLDAMVWLKAGRMRPGDKELCSTLRPWHSYLFPADRSRPLSSRRYKGDKPKAAGTYRQPFHWIDTESFVTTYHTKPLIRRIFFKVR